MPHEISRLRPAAPVTSIPTPTLKRPTLQNLILNALQSALPQVGQSRASALRIALVEPERPRKIIYDNAVSFSPLAEYLDCSVHDVWAVEHAWDRVVQAWEEPCGNEERQRRVNHACKVLTAYLAVSPDKPPLDLTHDSLAASPLRRVLLSAQEWLLQGAPRQRLYGLALLLHWLTAPSPHSLKSALACLDALVRDTGQPGGIVAHLSTLSSAYTAEELLRQLLSSKFPSSLLPHHIPSPCSEEEFTKHEEYLRLTKVGGTQAAATLLDTAGKAPSFIWRSLIDLGGREARIRAADATYEPEAWVELNVPDAGEKLEKVWRQQKNLRTLDAAIGLGNAHVLQRMIVDLQQSDVLLGCVAASVQRLKCCFPELALELVECINRRATPEASMSLERLGHAGGPHTQATTNSSASPLTEQDIAAAYPRSQRIKDLCAIAVGRPDLHARYNYALCDLIEADNADFVVTKLMPPLCPTLIDRLCHLAATREDCVGDAVVEPLLKHAHGIESAGVEAILCGRTEAHAMVRAAPFIARRGNYQLACSRLTHGLTDPNLLYSATCMVRWTFGQPLAEVFPHAHALINKLLNLWPSQENWSDRLKTIKLETDPRPFAKLFEGLAALACYCERQQEIVTAILPYAVFQNVDSFKQMPRKAALDALVSYIQRLPKKPISPYKEERLISAFGSFHKERIPPLKNLLQARNPHVQNFALTTLRIFHPMEAQNYYSELDLDPDTTTSLTKKSCYRDYRANENP